MNSLQHKETSDQYLHIMCHLNSRWRVIRCRHDLQWIIQRRSSADLNKGHWVGQSYHMTLESLRANCLGVTARLKTHSSELLNGAKSLAIKND